MTTPNDRFNQASDALRKRTGFLNGFKEFISRGNAIELAVGIVIGAAFTAVVSSIVDGIITPIIAGIFGAQNFDDVLAFQIRDATVTPGLVLSAIVNFLIVAAAIYFIVVLPLNKLAERRKQGVDPEPEAPAEDVILLGEIRDLLKAQGPQAPRL